MTRALTGTIADSIAGRKAGAAVGLFAGTMARALADSITADQAVRGTLDRLACTTTGTAYCAIVANQAAFGARAPFTRAADSTVAGLLRPQRKPLRTRKP